MRLPNDTKVAFSSAALFAQQANMTTHDASLQQMLVALHAAVRRILQRDTELDPEKYALTDLVFNVNFADAAQATEKTYKVQLTHPISAQFDLRQLIDPKTLAMSWRVGYNDWTSRVAEPSEPTIKLAPPTHDGRDLRSIDLD